MKVPERIGKPTYNDFVFTDSRMYARAYKQMNVSFDPSDIEASWEKCSDFLWRSTVDGKSQRQILMDIGVNPDDYLEKAHIDPLPNPPGDIDAFNRRGTSIASSLLRNSYDYKDFLRRCNNLGLNYTCINIFSAVWPSMAPDGAAIWPFTKLPSGQWDLDAFNPAFLDKTLDYIRVAHENGIHVGLTLLELYGWSNRKKGEGTPDANFGPFRNNVNNVKWGGLYNGDRKQDDATLTSLPDAWLKRFLDWFAPPVLNLAGVSCKIGNEMPEKDLHERMRDYIRTKAPNAHFIVNRNEDTAGQYLNMKIGSAFDMIEFHGWESLNFLNHNWGGPDEYPNTFKQFFNKKNDKGQSINVDFKNVICNSDGARANDNDTDTYDWDELFEVFKFCWKKGCTIDHQSQVKMTGDLNNLEAPFLTKLAQL